MQRIFVYFFTVFFVVIFSLEAASLAADKKTAALRTLTVLSYNINGLPPPIKSGKGPHFKRIAEILLERRAAGTHPAIVVIQEAFDGRANIVAETAGYKYVLRGPGRKDTSKRGNVHWAPKTRKAYISFSDPQKFTGSGLLILSDYPIVEARHKTFNSDECAGIDCLSNKSILMARIQVPGWAEPVDIITSHFNSRGAAKAPKKTELKIHRRQSDVLRRFLDKTTVGNALILAGDFNTKQTERYQYFFDIMKVQDVGNICIFGNIGCTLAEKTPRDTVLYNTNDKHFSKNGKEMHLSPILIKRNFDEILNGKPLSDHLGYEVTYALEGAS